MHIFYFNYLLLWIILVRGIIFIRMKKVDKVFFLNNKIIIKRIKQISSDLSNKRIWNSHNHISYLWWFVSGFIFIQWEILYIYILNHENNEIKLPLDHHIFVLYIQQYILIILFPIKYSQYQIYLHWK